MFFSIYRALQNQHAQWPDAPTRRDVLMSLGALSRPLMGGSKPAR